MKRTKKGELRMMPKDMNCYKNLNYSFEACQKNDQFVLSIRELGLSVVGDSLEEAYLKLKEAKLKYIENKYAKDEEDSIPLPSAFWNSIKIYMPKALAVGSVALIIILVILFTIKPYVDLVVKIPTLKNEFANISDTKLLRMKFSLHRFLQKTEPIISEIDTKPNQKSNQANKSKLTSTDVEFLENTIKKLREKKDSSPLEKNGLEDLLKLIRTTNSHIEEAITHGALDEVEYYKTEIKIFIDKMKKSEESSNVKSADPIVVKLQALR